MPPNISRNISTNILTNLKHVFGHSSIVFQLLDFFLGGCKQCCAMGAMPCVARKIGANASGTHSLGESMGTAGARNCDTNKVGLTEEDSRVCLDELSQLLTSTKHINTFSSMLMDYHQMKKDNGARYQIARRGLARDPNAFAQYDATNACYAMIATMIASDAVQHCDFMSNVVVIGDYVECILSENIPHPNASFTSWLHSVIYNFRLLHPVIQRWPKDYSELWTHITEEVCAETWAVAKEWPEELPKGGN